MDIENILKKKVKEYLLFKYSISNDLIEISKTRKEFQGHYTIVLFPLLPILKKPPIEIGNEIGLFLQEKEKYIQEFNVIQGFLNLTFSDRFLTDLLKGFNLNYN